MGRRPKSEATRDRLVADGLLTPARATPGLSDDDYEALVSPRIESIEVVAPRGVASFQDEAFALTPSEPKMPPESGQDYATPWEFVRAVENRFGPMVMDLAATADNTKAPAFFTKEDDALSRDWTKLKGNLWLNPPYKKLGLWAVKCNESRTLGSLRKIFLLCLASVSTEWFAENVHGNALVLFVRPRIEFVGAAQGIDRDLILCVFGAPPGYEPWNWREQAKA
jgi:phage N-6-adenine-methyltransferase